MLAASSEDGRDERPGRHAPHRSPHRRRSSHSADSSMTMAGKDHAGVPEIAARRQRGGGQPRAQTVGERRDVVGGDHASAGGHGDALEELRVQPGVGHLEIGAADQHRSGRGAESRVATTRLRGDAIDARAGRARTSASTCAIGGSRVRQPPAAAPSGRPAPTLARRPPRRRPARKRRCEQQSGAGAYRRVWTLAGRVS